MYIGFRKNPANSSDPWLEKCKVHCNKSRRTPTCQDRLDYRALVRDIALQYSSFDGRFRYFLHRTCRIVDLMECFVLISARNERVSDKLAKTSLRDHNNIFIFVNVLRTYSTSIIDKQKNLGIFVIFSSRLPQCFLFRLHTQ